MTAGKTQSEVDPADVPGKGEGNVPLSLWRVIRRRKWKIAVGVVVGLSLGVLFGVLTGPWYESTAEILVVKKQLQTEPLSGPSRDLRQDDYLATHMLLITSPRVVERAVKTEKLETLRCFSRDGVLDRAKSVLSRLLLGPGRPISEQDRVTQEIVDSLIVSRDAQKPGTPPSNEVMIVAFRGKDADDCKKVLDAIVASYKSFLKESFRDGTEETLALIEWARKSQEQDVKAKEAAYKRIVDTAPSEILKGKDDSTPEKIKAQLTEVWRRQFQVQALLKQIDAALKRGLTEAEVVRLILPTDTPLLPPLPGVEKSNTKTSLEERLINLQVQEKDLLRTYGEKHPEVLKVRGEIESVKSLIKPPAGPGGGTELPETVRVMARLRIEQLREELKQHEGTEEALNKRLKKELDENAAATRHAIKKDLLKSDFERSQILYDTIVKRIQELSSLSEYSGYSTQEIAAPEFGRWAIKKILLTAALSLFFGLLLGFGWAYRTDVRDRSFRTAEEIRQALGWRVLGHIPILGKARKEAAAEAFRAVRTALYFTPSWDAKRIIQVTGPNQGAGKTTLTAHLAASIAQSGKRVLIVDADLRKPSQHKIYGAANDVGLTTVLAGGASASEAIQPTPIPGLFLLPGGPLGPNPAELLSSPRLGELLSSLREQYDYVLIDTPPLLAVTDPSIVAHHVDGVLVVIRLSKRSRPQAQVAKEVLVGAGADVLGVVVNGVPRRSGPDSLIYECYPLGVAYEGASA
jgi:polysaccharide biosynthesis transport protein